MAITDTLQRDANQVPLDKLGLIATKSITYVAATTGAVGATDLFKVTGTVALQIFGVCSVNIAGSGTIEVGIAGVTAGLIAQTTGTDIYADKIWVDNAPAKIETLPSHVVLTGQTIIQTIGTDTLTAGTITYYCCWTPVTSSASVVAA